MKSYKPTDEEQFAALICVIVCLVSLIYWGMNA